MTFLKKISNVKWLLTAFLAVAAVTSCGFDNNDDDEPATYPLELLGAWQGVDITVTVTDPEGVDSPSQTESLANHRIVINSNGTVVTYGLNSSGEWREDDRAFWKYKDKVLQLVNKDSKISQYNVLTLDNYRLTLKSVTSDAPNSGGDIEMKPDDGTSGGVATGNVIVTSVMTYTRLMSE